MSRKKDDKRLDEIISRTINSGRPEFDAEKWKQKYPKEFQMLRSMSKQDSPSRQPSIWRIVSQSPITKIAAAAVIIVGIGLVIHLGLTEKPDTTIVSKATKSPAEMQAILSLSIAYRRGGIEAVEDQCRKAIEMLGPRPAEITTQQILTEFNGT